MKTINNYICNRQPKEKLNKIIKYVSPAGDLEMAFSDRGLLMLDWTANKRHEDFISRFRDIIIEPSTWQVEKLTLMLDRYFRAESEKFEIAVDLRFSSEFATLVLSRLVEIPYGTTMTYSDYARLLGREEAVRAVSGAIARNPISIVIPCHRIVGAGNRLTGYAGGLDSKRYLLQLESVTSVH